MDRGAGGTTSGLIEMCMSGWHCMRCSGMKLKMVMNSNIWVATGAGKNSREDLRIYMVGSLASLTGC